MSNYMCEYKLHTKTGKTTSELSSAERNRFTHIVMLSKFKELHAVLCYTFLFLYGVPVTKQDYTTDLEFAEDNNWTKFLSCNVAQYLV